MTLLRCEDCGEKPELLRRTLFASRLNQHKYIARCDCGNGVSYLAHPLDSVGYDKVSIKWNDRYGDKSYVEEEASISPSSAEHLLREMKNIANGDIEDEMTPAEVAQNALDSIKLQKK